MTVATAFLYGAGYASIGFAFLFFAAVWQLLRLRGPLWHRTSLDLPFAVWSAVLIVSALLSPYRPLALGITLMLIVSGAVYFGAFTWLFARDSVARELTWRAWALGSPIAAFVGLAAGPLGPLHLRAEIPRGVGPNGLGTTMMLGSIVAIGLAFRARGSARVLWFGCSLISLVGLLATWSRASLGGWVVGAAYLGWRELRGRPRRFAALAAAAAVIVAASVFLIPDLAHRFEQTFRPISTLTIRAGIWRTSIRMVGARPWFGTGFGTFQRAYDVWRVRSTAPFPEPFAFNFVLNLAVETGLAGLAAVGWAVWTTLRAACGRPDAPWQPLLVALWIGLLVDQLADNTLWSISTSAALWLLIALTMVPDPRPVAVHIAGIVSAAAVPEDRHLRVRGIARVAGFLGAHQR